MTKIDDNSFFDLLFQQFTKTTNAETAYWMNEEDGQAFGNPLFSIYAVGQDQEKVLVAKWMSEADADFVTAVAGCFPDLVRRLHAALDEADRADREHDEREVVIFNLALEVENVTRSLTDREQQIGRLSLENQELREECARLEETLATARSKAADVLWKSERWV